MRNLTVVFAVLALSCTAVMADFVDDFATQDQAYWTGTNPTGGPYTPGVYTLRGNGGVNSGSIFAGPGYMSSGNANLLPLLGMGSSASVIRNSTDVGGGTYTFTQADTWYGGMFRSASLFGVQDTTHFYYVYSRDYDHDGSWNYMMEYHVGYADGTMVDGSGNTVLNATDLAVFRPDPAMKLVGIKGVNGVTTVTWDPAAGTINVGLLMTAAADGSILLSNASAVSIANDGNITNSGSVGGANFGDTYNASSIGFTAGVVPEPATMTMLVLGGIGALLRRRK